MDRLVPPRARSRAQIIVLEKEIAGFGASGRNGGWCSALFPRSTASLERAHGRDAALAMRRAMIATVDEVGRARRGGDRLRLRAGRHDRLRAHPRAVARGASRGRRRRPRYGVDPLELWGRRVTPRGARRRVDPACARIHPAKLVRGLAAAVEARGVRIAEQTEVLGSPGRVETAHGTVTADRIVSRPRATARAAADASPGAAALLADDRDRAAAR